MPSQPPTVSRPPTQGPLINTESGHAVQSFTQWLELMFLRVGGALGRDVPGDIAVYQTTVGQAALASGGTVILLDALSGEEWKTREIFLSGAGTNFSGGGGDRLLTISDGTSTWSIIPAATLQSLAVARWGNSGVPFPATAAHLTTASVVGVDITASYSGGTSDYTAGSLTLVLTMERTA